MRAHMSEKMQIEEITFEYLTKHKVQTLFKGTPLGIYRLDGHGWLLKVELNSGAPRWFELARIVSTPLRWVDKGDFLVLHESITQETVDDILRTIILANLV